MRARAKGNEGQMLELLLERFAQDPEAQIVPTLTRWFADPLKPEGQEGRFRPNPVFLLVGVIGLIAAGAFLYFGYSAQ
jgi:hypothetical protein